MHEPFFLRGTLLYSSSPDTIEILDDGWLLCRNGKAAGVFRQKPERFKNLDVLDYSGKLIIPGMTDPRKIRTGDELLVSGAVMTASGAAKP